MGCITRRFGTRIGRAAPLGTSLRAGPLPPPHRIFLSRATLVVVPPELIDHWHTQAGAKDACSAACLYSFCAPLCMTVCALTLLAHRWCVQIRLHVQSEQAGLRLLVYTTEGAGRQWQFGLACAHAQSLAAPLACTLRCTMQRATNHALRPSAAAERDAARRAGRELTPQRLAWDADIVLSEDAAMRQKERRPPSSSGACAIRWGSPSSRTP